MSGFEFFFSLYGLVLGLSVVEIISGFARLVHNRGAVRVGWLVPALAILMLFDLANFWMSAFVRLQAYEPSYGMLIIGLLISSLYYVAASAVFPRDFQAEPDFDAVYLRHRRLVLGLMTVAGLLAFELLPSLNAAGRAARLHVWTTPGEFWQPLLFFAAVGVIVVTRSKWINLAMLSC
ncbi:hypothetical protein [Glacieibacterium frigidum]|uniref:Uncharacterized protein n=1 Tax=Glacieibacterium frigidum TaxID=2593303 RepID=A0A552U962_9SPHN|nr:hypothetical protein [Glacieibacterium frigidum]TRW14748.1 hypothetical protein FMM06_13775 [Glacieibacterium frigidum]